MRIHIDDENVSNDEDSDETILEAQSPQLVLSQPHLHKQVIVIIYLSVNS